MKLPEFLESGQPRWSELEALMAEAGRRAETLGATRLRRFVELYRAASADLAMARRLFPGDPVISDLERQVVRARGLLFDRSGSRESVGSFFGQTYWRLVHERTRPMLLAAVALLIPALLETIEIFGYKVPVIIPSILVLLGGLIFRVIMVEAGQITRYLY